MHTRAHAQDIIQININAIIAMHMRTARVHVLSNVKSMIMITHMHSIRMYIYMYMYMRMHIYM